MHLTWYKELNATSSSFLVTTTSEAKKSGNNIYLKASCIKYQVSDYFCYVGTNSATRLII
jgi:hypothetical protein